MQGCDITRAGIGRLETVGGDVEFCCTPAMARRGDCDYPGHLLIETSGIAARAISIPATGELGNVDFDDLIEIMNEGTYVVLVANCHPQGRPVHMTGGIEWINVPESATAELEDEIGSGPTPDNGHQDAGSDTSTAVADDKQAGDHVEHAHHAKTFAETFHEVSFSVKDETRRELEANEILPFVGVGIVGILIIGIVLRQKNLTRRYHLYDHTDLEELSIADDEEEMFDIDIPDTSLPNQRPETKLSVQL
jgi:hypothetical protein